MMRITFLFFSILFCNISLAQGPQKIIKINPLGILVGQFQFGYEQALNDNFSFQLSAGLIAGSSETNDSLSQSFVKTSKLGYIIIPEVRYYFKDNACDGAYFAGLGRFRHVKRSFDETSWSSRTAIGGAIVLGYNRVIDGLSVDMFLGPQFKTFKENSVGDLSYSFNDFFGLSSNRTGVRFGINIGLEI